MTASARTKLEAARARLVLERPFIASLLLHLALVPDASCRIVATDGVRLCFNARDIDRLDLAQAQFMLAHEALHCALGHLWRRGSRERRRWDVACDCAVNLLLVGEGMTPPPGALCDARFGGLAAEEIYPLLSDARYASMPTLDTHWFDASRGAAAAALPKQESGSGSDTGDEGARPRTDDDAHWDDAAPQARRHAGVQREPIIAAQDALAQQWRLRLAMAAQQASERGRLGTSWQRVLGRLLQPALPWSALLARFLAERAYEDYSFQRPSRREGDALLPRLRSQELELVVIIDSSGSVSDEQLQRFGAEIDAIKAQVRARVTLHACDERMAAEGPWEFEPWQPIRMPSAMAGGGGTDFRPAFEWAESRTLRPDLLLYFTDAQGEFPQRAPPFPVLWLVLGAAQVPFGERIQLN